jgi:hypothetical protein
MARKRYVIDYADGVEDDYGEDELASGDLGVSG